MKHLTIFSYRQRDTEWQDAVIAKLDSLEKSQNDLHREVADHTAEGRPTRRGRLIAVLCLVLTVLLISLSVTATGFASAYQTEAQSAFDQAQTALEQVNGDLQPIDNLVAKYGAAYLYAHPNKSDLADLQAAEGPAQQVAKYRAEGSDLDWKFILSEQAGQILLATSSACFGAIAGWLLIPALLGRQRKRSKPQPSGS